MIASSSRTAGEKRVKTFCWHSGMSKRVERMIKEGQPFMMSQTPRGNEAATRPVRRGSRTEIAIGPQRNLGGSVFIGPKTEIE